MPYKHKKLLFYFDQYFTVKLGEKLYKYNSEADNWSFVRSFVALLRVFVSLLKSKEKINTASRKPYKHLFYIDTINQRNAVGTFLQRMDSEDILLVLFEGLNNANLEFPKGFDHCHLPRKRLYLWAMFTLPKAFLMGRVLRTKYLTKINGAHVYINLALFLSAVKIFDSDLKRFTPTSVTVVNDHNLFPLALVYAARQNSIASAYIQHASVSDVFPKLLVDTALLEGMHSLETYNRIGNLSKKQILVGIPRMDGYINSKNKALDASGRIVGLCVKPYYPITLIEELIENIRKAGSVSNIVLRPHPGTIPGYYTDVVEKFNLKLSNSRVEQSVDFLKRIDVLVSGESSIILEAALIKTPSLYFDDKVFPVDLYGYVKHGITISVEPLTAIPNAISSITERSVEQSFLKCKYYCDTVGTVYENRSVDILLDFYNSKANG